LETQQAFVDGAPGGDEYQQLADSCDQWLSLGLVDDAAAAWEGTTVIHTPLLAAQLAAGTLILPTPFPVAAGDGPRVPRHGALHPRITACELAQLLDACDADAQYWACGPAAEAVCRLMESVPSRRRGAGLTSVIVVDRATDLAQVLSHGDSLPDRIAALLPPASAGSADVAVDMAAAFPACPHDLPAGSLAHDGSTAAGRLLSELVRAKNKVTGRVCVPQASMSLSRPSSDLTPGTITNT